MNVTLVGMSGVGKSFLGKKLSDQLGYEFIDTDRLLEERFHKPIQDVLNSLGDKEFLVAEEAEVLGLDDVQNTIISPGGSIVYSSDAVSFLKRISTVIYLVASADWLMQRTTPTERGIVGLSDRSFEDLHAERHNLYEAMADYTISVPGKNSDLLVKEITINLGLD